MTQDGGKSWKNILIAGPVTFVAFGKSDSIIFALIGEGPRLNSDILFVTTDMGNSWKQTAFGGLAGWGLTIGIDGTIYVFSVNDGFRGTFNGWINSSTDDGQTWSSNGGNVDGDSYTLIADSCNAATLFLSHEGMISSFDQKAHIFLSSDAGVTWQTIFTASIGVIAGNITAGKTAIYAGTQNSTGVLRSLDQGNSWQSIGGPPLDWDTHDIAAMNDNTVFAIDTAGNIWATYNSGGDSITLSSYPSDLSAVPDTVFTSDTISCDSLTRTVMFSRGFCSPDPDSIIGWSIIGQDSANFRASNLSYDSASVTMYGTKQGKQNAQLVLLLDNGKSYSVTLTGYVGNPNTLAFNFNSTNITCHAGDTIDIPVYLSGNITLGATSITLPFGLDTKVLQPIGFQSAIAGITVGSITYSGGTGTVPLQANGLALNGETLIGTLRCIVYLSDTLATSVSLASASLTSVNAPCVSLSLTTDSVNILINGCGDLTLLQFMRTGQIPLGIQSIVPNPATDAVQISFINPTSSAISYQIFDALGQTRLNGLTASNALSLDVSSLPQGVYFFRATNGTGFSASSKLVIVR